MITRRKKCWIITEFELTELFAVPASRVDANNEFSTGRLHASIDHGALSYILSKYVHTKEWYQLLFA